MATKSPRRSGANRPPKYSRQKEKGRADRAYIWHDDKKIMLGRYGSAESREKYNELISPRIEANVDPEPSTEPTVSELIAAYLEHAETYYRKADGQPSGEYDHFFRVAKLLRPTIGTELAKNIGPKRLKLIRESMIEKGWSRCYVNDQCHRIVRMFRFGVSEEMIEASVCEALKAVENLHQGRSAAKESVPVLPVADEDVAATLEHLPMLVADMVRVQRLTGMRPGELVIMRPCDIDRTREVWLYKPSTHKTAHRGHTRVIAIGPKCQEILLSYLARGAEDFLFQPRDSESKRRAVRTAERKTPKSCGNVTGSNRKARPKLTAGESYTPTTYCRAITRAAKKAKVAKWTPHRLRHTAATEVRREFGLDSAQAILGHRNAVITQVYAELDTAKAAAVALRIG